MLHQVSGRMARTLNERVKYFPAYVGMGRKPHKGGKRNMIYIRAEFDNKYTKDGIIEIEEIADLDDELFAYYEHVLEEVFDEYLDDSGDAVIFGHRYATSEALKAVDETLYRTAFLEYWDVGLADARAELERGNEYRIGGMTLYVDDVDDVDDLGF